MKITKPFLKDLRGDLDEALAGVAAKHGVSLKSASISYRGQTANIKVELTVPDSTGEIKSKEAIAFEQNAWVHGLKPNDLGRTFMYRGDEYRITGMKPRATKYPIVAVNKDDQAYKFPVGVVKAGLASMTSTRPPACFRFIDEIKEKIVQSVPFERETVLEAITRWEEDKDPRTPVEYGVASMCQQIADDIRSSS